jgi:hypothetical protein
MPTIQILVFVTEDIGHEVPGPIEPGKRFVFTNNLRLDRYDDSTPGSGLPQDPNDRMAGTHSGVVTIVRVVEPGAVDPFFPSPSLLFQYEATYKFNTLDDTPLQKGQVTAQGLFLIDNVEDFNALETPIRFAITGGTGPYATAHGTITEGVPYPESRLLDIEL